MKKIVLCVSGSIAAIEAPKLARRLREKNLELECVMSDSACQIIHPDAMEWAVKKKPILRISGQAEHVKFCGFDPEADLLLIYPATANIIGKIAGGIADCPISTFALCALGAGMHIVVVPAMHLAMYENPFTTDNIKKLKDNNITIVEPNIDLKEKKAKIAPFDEVISSVLKWI